MKSSSTPRLGRLLALITAGLTASLSAQVAPSASGSTAAAAAASSVVQLPKFEVSAIQANPYLPNDALSVNRVAGSILDSPLTVNVLTADFMNDIGAQSMYDATQYMSGISNGRAAGVAGVEDRTDYRGFESFGKTIDNFSGVLLPIGNGFMAQFDPAFVDRIELVMGPDSILAPTGSPGGSANIITKSPLFEHQTTITGQVGNFNAQKLIVDSTGALGNSQHWAYRVIGSFQDTPTYMPGSVHQANASAMLEYAFSPTAALTFKFFEEKWQINGSIAANADNGEEISTANTVNGATLSNTPQPGWEYNGWGGNANWNSRFDTMQTEEIEFHSALGDHVTMRLAGDVLSDNYGDYIAFPKNSPAETFNPHTGAEISVAPINPAALPVIADIAAQQSRQIQLQNDYAGNFHAGPVSLEPVVGWSTQQGSDPRISQIQDSTLPAVNLVNNPTGYYNPAPPPLSAFTTFSSNHPEEASLESAYATMRAGLLNDHVFLTGGVSRTWATVNDYSFKGMYVPGVGQVGAAPGTANYLQDFTFQNTGLAVAPTQDDYHDTQMFGVVVKPLPNLSLYASDSTNAGIASANPLWQAGKQIEFGAKADFFDQRLQVTVAHYQISESNVSANNPLYSTGQSSSPNILLNETNHGIEFNVAGGLTKDLSVIASFTEMHLRDPFGRRLVNVPDTMASAFLNYDFRDGVLKNFNVFGGAHYEGNIAGETVTGLTPLGVPEQPGFYLPPHEVVNAGCGYTMGRYRYNLNVDNLLNSKFWWEPAGRISVAPYPGLNVRLSVSLSL